MTKKNMYSKLLLKIVGTWLCKAAEAKPSPTTEKKKTRIAMTTGNDASSGGTCNSQADVNLSVSLFGLLLSERDRDQQHHEQLAGGSVKVSGGRSLEGCTDLTVVSW